MNKIKKQINKEHKAIGGLYFIFSSIICAFIMTIILQLSYTSQMVTIIDNAAFIVATDALAVNYNGNSQSFESNDYFQYVDNSSFNNNLKTYYPIDKLNDIINDWTVSNSINGCKIKYDNFNKHLTLQFGEIRLNNFDITITPHQQDVIIE